MSPDAGPSDALVADVFARDCASRQTLEDVASKWGILAMLALGEGDLRFNALRRKVDGVSEKMLSQTLQNLERDGLVLREVHSTIPPRVEYSLTPLGSEVARRLRGLADVLEAASVQLGQNRTAYDTRSAGHSRGVLRENRSGEKPAREPKSRQHGRQPGQQDERRPDGRGRQDLDGDPSLEWGRPDI